MKPINEYREAVKTLAQSNSNLIFQNNDAVHASIVLENFFMFSNEEMRIYDEDLSGDIVDKSEVLLNNIIEFITLGKILKIIIRDNSTKDSKLCKTLIDLRTKYPKNVFLKTVNKKFSDTIVNVFNKDINFSVGDSNMFRLEVNNERKAFCSFNNTEYSTKLMSAFDKYFYQCPNIR